MAVRVIESVEEFQQIMEDLERDEPETELRISPIDHECPLQYQIDLAHDGRLPDVKHYYYTIYGFSNLIK